AHAGPWQEERMTDTPTLTHAGKELQLPLVEAVEGNHGLDIAALRKDTGDVTYDVGYGNTASCKSDITYIDGDAGILRYRGDPLQSDRRLAAARLRAGGHRHPAAPALHAGGADEELLRRLPHRRAPDAGAVLGRVRAGHLLRRQQQAVRPRARGDLHDPAD